MDPIILDFFSQSNKNANIDLWNLSLDRGAWLHCLETSVKGFILWAINLAISNCCLSNKRPRQVGWESREVMRSEMHKISLRIQEKWVRHFKDTINWFINIFLSALMAHVHCCQGGEEQRNREHEEGGKSLSGIVLQYFNIVRSPSHRKWRLDNLLLITVDI